MERTGRALDDRGFRALSKDRQSAALAERHIDGGPRLVFAGRDDDRAGRLVAGRQDRRRDRRAIVEPGLRPCAECADVEGVAEPEGAHFGRSLLRQRGVARRGYRCRHGLGPRHVRRDIQRQCAGLPLGQILHRHHLQVEIILDLIRSNPALVVVVALLDQRHRAQQVYLVAGLNAVGDHNGTGRIADAGMPDAGRQVGFFAAPHADHPDVRFVLRAEVPGERAEGSRDFEWPGLVGCALNGHLALPCCGREQGRKPRLPDICWQVLSRTTRPREQPGLANWPGQSGVKPLPLCLDNRSEVPLPPADLHKPLLELKVLL